MTNKQLFSACLLLVFLVFTGTVSHSALAQEPGVKVTGTVTESGTGLPLELVAVSVSSTGISSATDEQGAFAINVPDLQAEIILNLPGYHLRSIYLNGRDHVEVSLVSVRFGSMDRSYNTPLGPQVMKDAAYPVYSAAQTDLALSKSTSFDQALQGRVPGLFVTEKSGMPGQRTFMNLRGFSSLFANTEPLVFIDGMIYDYSFAQNSLMEGFALNPFDVVDIDDISDLSVQKDGISYLGAAGSHGVIYINTEQKAEVGTVIKFGAYGGITLVPENQSLLNASQFRDYFENVLLGQGYNTGQIDAMYPWLHGNASSLDYYKYNNSTDWQEELYKPAAVSKFHFFLKGGDDIATYNISVGYLKHNGIYDNSGYNRFNLRINGKVNITDKFSVTPNAKLSLADSELANHGPDEWKNPILSALLKPPIMAPVARDASTGEDLTYLDDVGVFGVSNPIAIVNSALGVNRNYHFLSSIRADYRFNEHFNLSTLWGINFNNARENIFLPDLGMVQVDSAYNSPGDFVNEFRSTQNHSMLTYTNRTASGHNIVANLGFRYLLNNFSYRNSIDLNTPSDDFKSLGDGNPGPYVYLQSTTGDDRELSWVSYSGTVDYNYMDKYFVNVNLSYDGNSATNSENRYNFYPSVAAAWRLSSEGFLNQAGWLEDLKLRGSYSVTGNMFSTVYDYSKLYYISRRLNSTGILTREIIPNENLELEKKSNINAGLDLSVLHQAVNLHADYFISNVNNLVVKQELPASYGFTDYYDNGGKLKISGIEAGVDARLQSGNFVWIIGGNVSKITTEVTSLEFINPETEHIITPITGAEFITSVGNPINAYYGYQTEGIISASEAGTIIGPNSIPMQAGDVKYTDVDGNGIINDADKMIIGDPNPDLFGNIFTSLSYGNFSLSVNVNYSMGNDLFNFVKYKTESMDTYRNQGAAVLDRWTPASTGAEVPRASIADPTGNTAFSDRWIEDGSYVRLDKLTLSYRFPTIAGFTNGVVLYVTATNLLTITGYSGYDPEFIYMNSPFYMGVDYGMMPQTRSFIAGLKLNL
jgi:TonB-linked SusC/RagA family outer membrane protein